jgi:hypothetical protein
MSESGVRLQADQELTAETRSRIAVAAGIALLVAGILTVIAVLPAEFAVDPTGIGTKVGLMQLGEVGKQVEQLEADKAAGSQAQLIAAQEKPFATDSETFTLGPKGSPTASIEFKYRLEKGESLLYSWTATAPVEYEFHAEPDSGPKGYAQSYDKSSGTTKSGTLTAPFDGIHGWYWENTTDQPVTVTLKGAGFFNIAHEFGPGGVKNKNFP